MKVFQKYILLSFENKTTAQATLSDKALLQVPSGLAAVRVLYRNCPINMCTHNTINTIFRVT